MNAVIKPWLVGCLVAAIAGSVLLSAVLIVQLSRFDDSKRQAEEGEARADTQRTALGKLQVEVESLTRQKDALLPTVADWQQRLKEKAAAEATLASFDSKQRQAESDITQADKRRDDANRALVELEKLKTGLNSTVDRLKAERDTLTKSNTDAKTLARQAEEADRRLNAATNALTNVDARLKQLDVDASAAQTRFEQIQKEADDLRQAREKTTTDLTGLRLQIQTQKDQLATLDRKTADFKALQSATQQEEQRLAKVQLQSATAEARTTEMEFRLGKAVAELASLTNRLEQARKDSAVEETRLDTTKAALQRIVTETAAAQKRLEETQVSQDLLIREQAKLVAQVAVSKKESAQFLKDAAESETRRNSAKTDLQKSDADFAAARTQLQVFVLKQSELTRETSRLETTVERLKKEKDALEKEIGRQEAQRQKASPVGQK